MFTATRALRQAAAHAERVPSIRFLGRRSTPSSIDHTPRPHPESPTGKLPEGFGAEGARSANFSSYRQHAQQHGPLQKTIRTNAEAGIGGTTGYELGSVTAPKGFFFDSSELPSRFHRRPIDIAELEAVESGGASLWG